MFYKDESGNLFHLESQDFSHLLPLGVIEITDDEAQSIIEASNPSPATLRKLAITDELQTIDADSARPARAVAVALAAGTPPNAFDLGKLQTLEAKAAALRTELAAL